MAPPDVLYHGSTVLVPVLEPISGAVNASHDRWVAMPFALVFLPDDRGRCVWSLRGSRIVLQHGSLDPCGVGYLYRLAPDRFEQVNPMVWLCREPVTPLDYEVIRGADYVDWIGRG